MVEIIAHRGASRDAPENTLCSVRLAWQQAADAVEIDCRLSSDGHIVVFHDDDTRRITGSRLTIADSPLAELRRLDYGRWKGSAWTGEPLPLLGEVIATMPPGKRLLIEVKCGEEIVPPLSRALRDSGRPPSDFVIISFDEGVLHRVKQSIRDATTYLIAETKARRAAGAAPRSVDDLIAQARAANADGLDLEATPRVDAGFVRCAERAGLPCYVWTVDTAREARRLIAAGVRGITTNRPGWLRQQLDRAGSSEK